MASNGTAIALLGGGALALVLLSSRKASAAQPGTPPTPSTPDAPAPSSPRPSAPQEEGDTGGGGGSSPSPSAPSSSAEDTAPSSSEPSSSAPSEQELDQLDPQERAEALAAAREAARQEAALEAKAKADAQKLAALKVLATRVIADVKTKGTKYDRALLKSFQTAAGITADGLYGAESKGALQRYSGLMAPAAQVAAPKATAPLQNTTEDKPTPNSTPGKQASGPVTAPFVSMPAERPSSSAPPASAKALAPSVAANLNSQGTGYDRKMLAAFQAAYGLKADGLYGPATQAALVKCGSNAPKALFRAASSSTTAKAPAASSPKAATAAPKPAATAKPVTVSPSTSKVDLAAARRMAGDVAANLRNKGKAGYDRKNLASFQEKAGITADGVYGPLAAAALKYFGASAPAAFFAGSVKSYTPPAA